jgi:hypothetical protein
MSPRAKSVTWRIVAVVFVVAMAALCWHNIAQTLDQPIYTHLAYGGDSGLERVTGGTAHATRTGVDSVGVELTHVSAQLRWLIALDLANASLLQASVVLVFGIIWVRTSMGHPFARAVTRSLIVLSVIVAVFGTLQDVLDSWVSLREAYEAVGSNPSGFYYDQDGFTVSLSWIFVGLAIGVLASAFGIGARLTHDTEGLV